MSKAPHAIFTIEVFSLVQILKFGHFEQITKILEQVGGLTMIFENVPTYIAFGDCSGRYCLGGFDLSSRAALYLQRYRLPKTRCVSKVRLICIIRRFHFYLIFECQRKIQTTVITC